MPSRTRTIVWAAGCLALAGCDAPPERDDASAQAAAIDSAGAPVPEPSAAGDGEGSVAQEGAPPRQPPKGAFSVEPWKSVRKGVEPVAPPEELVEPWRAFVNQERPRQKKNPKWQPLPPKATTELQMPEGSAFRCQVSPLTVRGEGTEAQDAVRIWVLTRRVQCSSDGWRTWTEDLHQVFVKPDGSRELPVERTMVLLREPTDEIVRETTVIVRSDKQKYLKATTGPPRENPEAPLD